MSIYPTNPRTWAQLDALDVRERRDLLDAQWSPPTGGGAGAAAGAAAAAPSPQQLGPRGRLRFLAAPGRDATIAAYFYPADPSTQQPKAVVIAVHGHGSYWQFEFLKMAAVGAPHVYAGSWVEALNRRGFSVCGVDNCGSGRSSGRFGLVDAAEHLRDDVLALAACVRGMGTAAAAAAGRAGGGAAAPVASRGAKRGAAAAAAAAPPRAPGPFGPALAGIPGFCASLPIFLLGPSLGGCVSVQAALAAEASLAATSAAAAASPPPFAGVVLLAPLLGLEGTASRGWNPYLRRAAALLDACPLTREWPVAAQEGNRMFPEQQLDFECDSVTYHYPCRVRTAVQLLRACAGVLPLPLPAAAAAGAAGDAAAAAAAAQRAGQPLREAAKRLRAPVLAFHSARDTLCDCGATEAFVAAARQGHEARRAAAAMAGAAAAAAGGGGGGAQMRRCDHLWHSVLREDGTDELLREAVAWMDARLASLAAAAAAAAAGGGGGAEATAAAHAAAAAATKGGRGGGCGAGSLKQVASAAARVTVGAAASASSPQKAAAVAAEAELAAPPRVRARRGGGAAAR